MNDRPRRVYEPWTRKEDEELLKNFDQGTTLKMLAADHQRSLGAIKPRLLHLGRVPR